MSQNRSQRRQDASSKGVSKNQLLARASAAEAATAMFKGFYEEQIRGNERLTIEAEQLVQQSRNEQRATERTIEVMLFQLGARGDAYVVTQEAIDAFNENDEEGEHFVNVEQTDDGFDMTLVFEPLEQEDEDAGPDDAEDDSEDSGPDGEEAADGDTDETG